MRIGLILLLWMLIACGVGAGIWYWSSAALKHENKRKELSKAEQHLDDHAKWQDRWLRAGGQLYELPSIVKPQPLPGVTIHVVSFSNGTQRAYKTVKQAKRIAKEQGGYYVSLPPKIPEHKPVDRSAEFWL